MIKSVAFFLGHPVYRIANIFKYFLNKCCSWQNESLPEVCPTWQPIISVRDKFRSRELKSLARIFFSIACTKIKWFCPNITWYFFCPKMAIWKFLGGLQPPVAPWPVRLNLWWIPSVEMFSYGTVSRKSSLLHRLGWKKHLYYFVGISKPVNKAFDQLETNERHFQREFLNCTTKFVNYTSKSQIY